MPKIFLNKNVFNISAGFFFLFMGFNTAQQYLLPVLKINGRESDAVVSLLLLYSVFLFSNLFAPYFISIFRTKKALILGGISYILFCLSVILDQTLVLYISSIFLGFGASLLWISSAQLITDSSRKNDVGQNLGFNLSALLAGSLVGTFLGTFMADEVSFRQFYLILAGICCSRVLFFIPIKDIERIRIDSKFKISYFFKAQFLLLFPIVFASQFYIAQTFAAINLIVLGAFGIFFVGVFAFIFRISSMAGSFVTGKISDQYNRVLILGIMAIIGLIGSFLFLATAGLVSKSVGILLLGIFTAGSFPVSLSLLKKSTTKNNFVYILSAFNITSNLAVLTALFGTKFMDVYDSFIPGILLLVFSLPALLLYNRISGSKS